MPEGIGMCPLKNVDINKGSAMRTWENTRIQDGNTLMGHGTLLNYTLLWLSVSSRNQAPGWVAVKL